jgi:hypothetical protein
MEHKREDIVEAAAKRAASLPVGGNDLVVHDGADDADIQRTRFSSFILRRTQNLEGVVAAGSRASTYL